MKNTDPDDSIKYLTNKENLSYTLDILRQGEDIRRHVRNDFWQSVRDKLRGSAPKKFRSQSLRWKLWPGVDRMDRYDAGLYCYPSQFERRTQFTSYFVCQAFESSSFEIYFGLMWEDHLPAKSGLFKLPSVKRLIEYLSENEFEQNRWILGGNNLFANENQDAFLLKYAKNADAVHRQIHESFWPFVTETFGMMLKANEAIRRAT